MMTFFYGITSVLLGIILFFPIRKFILALNVNRHQAKANRSITDKELEVLKGKVTIAAVVIAVTFAFLYNKILIYNFY